MYILTNNSNSRFLDLKSNQTQNFMLKYDQI